MAKINGIPVFEALVDEEEGCGMTRVSLVDKPAVLTDFVSFDEHRQPQMYAVKDEEKRLVWGVLMRADFPIYRNDKEHGEYYIIYTADTIRQMAEKYLLEGRQELVNQMHIEGSDVKGVDMVQFCIQDHERGIVPSGFDDIADGSLFAEYHILNDEVWEKVKDGTFKGFSIECLITMQPADKEDAARAAESKEFTQTNKKNMAKTLKQIALELLKVVSRYGAVGTDKGLLVWDSEEDLAAGFEVFIEDAEGERTTAPDGDYTTEDGKVVVVVDGRVSEIKDAEAEVAPEENTVKAGEEAAPAEDPIEEPHSENDLEHRIARLEQELAQIAELLGIVVIEARKANEAPATDSAHDAYRKAPKEEKTLSDYRKMIRR